MTATPDTFQPADAAKVATVIAGIFLGPLAVGAGFASREGFDPELAETTADLIVDAVRAALLDALTDDHTAEQAVVNLLVLRTLLGTVGGAADTLRKQLTRQVGK